MIIIQPQIKIDKEELDKTKLLNIERYTRVCYKSEPKNNSDNVIFLKKIIASGHESVIEHEKVTVIFIVDRGVTHQIIRHRIASYSHESTRYCNYSSDKFGNEITVIEPFFFGNNNDYNIWKTACLQSEEAYIKLCETTNPEQARTVLPNSLKAELVTTYNFREWRHFFNLRCSRHAHPQMRQIAIPLLLLLKEHFYPIFDDIPYDETFSSLRYAKVEIV